MNTSDNIDIIHIICSRDIIYRFRYLSLLFSCLNFLPTVPTSIQFSHNSLTIFSFHRPHFFSFLFVRLWSISFFTSFGLLHNALTQYSSLCFIMFSFYHFIFFFLLISFIRILSIRTRFSLFPFCNYCK